MSFHRTFGLFLALASAAASLLAQARLTASAEAIPVTGSARFHAEREGAGAQPEWVWTLTPAHGGSLTPVGPQEAVFTPGFLLRTETFTVEAVSASGPRVAARRSIRVETAGAMDKVLGDLLPAYLGHDPFVPWVDLLAGDPGEAGSALGPGSAARFSHVRALAFVPQHPDPACRGAWAVLDSGNRALLRMLPGGELAPWPGTAELKLEAKAGREFHGFLRPVGIAVQPWQAGKDRDADWRALITDDWSRSILALDAKGQLQVLTGGSRGPFRDGDLAEAVWSRPSGVACAAGGVAYVVDRGFRVLRRIHQGRVTTLAGDPEWDPSIDRVFFATATRDGRGSAARFFDPTALALDPDTGNLLVLDGEAVRRVSPDGEVLTLAGIADPCDRWDDGRERKAPAMGRPDRLAGFGCFKQPSAIAVFRGRAFIADAGGHAIRVLHLGTGALATLVGGGWDRPFRAGRIGPDTDPKAEAAGRLRCPSGIALDPDGHCLVSLWTSILELSLDDFEHPLAAGADAARPDPGDGKAEVKADPPVADGLAAAAWRLVRALVDFVWED